MVSAKWFGLADVSHVLRGGEGANVDYVKVNYGQDCYTHGCLSKLLLKAQSQFENEDIT